MKRLWFLLVGVFFGIVLFKSEAASWFRIYEMFRFDAFHMYGIIGSALALGVVFTQWTKNGNRESFFGEKITIESKQKSFWRYALGGIIFGLGWALAGACPGPMYALMGAGYIPIVVVILGALIGTLCYGLLKQKLPH